MTMKRNNPRRYRGGWAILVLAGLLGLPTQAPAQAPDFPQVRIEAKILEWVTSNNFDFDFAVNYAASGASSILQAADLTLPATPSLGSAARLFMGDMDVAGGTFDAVIETMETVGEVEVLFEPTLVLTSAQVAPGDMAVAPAGAISKMTNNRRIPYQTSRVFGVTLAEVTEYREAGVVLAASVIRVENDLIILDMTTSVTDLTGFINIGSNRLGDPMSVPTFDTRSIHNRLILRDRRVFIAGLIKTTSKTFRRQGIPWIGELPIFRFFMTNRHSRTDDAELVFLVKPEIVTPYQLSAIGDQGAAQ